MDAQSRPKWERLGRLLAERRARIDPRFVIRKTFAQATGLNLGLLRDIENAVRDTFSPSTLAAVETAYRWAPGSIDRILDGGQPVEIARVTATSTVALGSYARGTAIRPIDTEHAGLSDGDIGTAIESESVIRLPKWLTRQIEQRGLDPDGMVASVEALRDVATQYGYTLAELLLEAGVVAAADLEIQPAPEPDGLEAFKRRAARILADPHLSPGQRKDAEAYFRKLLAGLEEERRGPA